MLGGFLWSELSVGHVPTALMGKAASPTDQIKELDKSLTRAGKV